MNNNRQGKLAEVIGNSRYQEGTLRVKIKYTRKHKKYKKIQNYTTSLQVQYDLKSPIHIGTKVYIINCRPVSKTKRWKIDKVVEDYVN